MFTHFRKLNETPYDNSNVSNAHCDNLNVYINSPFSLDEIVDVIQSIKCDKSAGHDGILPELIKYAPNDFAAYLNYFSMKF